MREISIEKSVFLSDWRKLYLKAGWMAKENMHHCLGLSLCGEEEIARRFIAMGSAFEQGLDFIEDFQGLPG